MFYGKTIKLFYVDKNKNKKWLPQIFNWTKGWSPEEIIFFNTYHLGFFAEQLEE